MELIFFLCFLVSACITPFVRKLAFFIGAVDKPDIRKVHREFMPRIGGLAIYISTMVGCFFWETDSEYLGSIIIGSTIIVWTGMLDDIFQLSPRIKLLGQVIASSVIVLDGNIMMQFINIPFGNTIEFHYFSIPISIIWIVAISNAINLIDGLDGLAAGVSGIAILTMGIVANSVGNVFVVGLCIILIGGIVGFLPYNFFPAKIFMGDTGALFLGFMIGVLSLLGFKNVTMISFIVPIIILGVPISDTVFAIIRRIVNKTPLSAPDKSHLHHCFLRLGYSHPKTVLLIYGMSMVFAIVSVVLTKINAIGSVVLVIFLLVGVEIVVEKVGLISRDYRPILNIFYEMKKSR